MKIKKGIFKKRAQLCVGFMLISMSLALFFYSAFYLRLLNHTEDKIEESVVARFDVPTEYISNDSFWWILSGKSDLKLLNYSTASYQGILHLNIENNPCSNSYALKMGGFEYAIPKGNDFELTQNFDIKPLDEKLLELTVFNYEECKLANGDSRNFGIRINGWKINGR